MGSRMDGWMGGWVDESFIQRFGILEQAQDVNEKETAIKSVVIQ